MRWPAADHFQPALAWSLMPVGSPGEERPAGRGVGLLVEKESDYGDDIRRRITRHI